MNVFRNYASKCKIQSCQDISLNKIFSQKYGTKKARRQEKATVKALQHFDDLYKGIFERKWNSIRLGLLSQSKHVALLNNFGDLEKTEESLKYEGAFDLRELIKEDKPDLVHIDNEEADIKLTSEYEDVECSENIDGKEVLKDSFPKGSDEFKTPFNNYELESDECNNDVIFKESEEVFDTDLSMSEALSKSQIDKSRLIDPSSGPVIFQDFMPVSEMRGQEQFVMEGDYYRFYKVNSDFPVNIVKEYKLPLPDHLRVYSYPRGDVSSFKHPKICSNGVTNYYLLDGASILVVLALGLEAGDKVLDMCAAPGGKSLAILQTMLPEHLVCNDSSISRCNRLNRVLRQYLYNYPDEWKTSVSVTTYRGEEFSSERKFNKILVDVPCTNDRVSATIDENNIFKSMRIRERLKLPELQTSLLERALRLVEPGGTIVYSTCTLSPIQNEGVVNVALQKVWRDFQMEFTVRDLNPGLYKLGKFYRFASNTGLKYGSLIVPFLPVNFGPMYFCKLVKNK